MAGRTIEDVRMSVMRKLLLSDLYYELDHEEKRYVRYGAGQIPKKPKKEKPGRPAKSGKGSRGKAQEAPQRAQEARRKGKEAHSGRPDQTPHKAPGKRKRG